MAGRQACPSSHKQKREGKIPSGIFVPEGGYHEQTYPTQDHLLGSASTHSQTADLKEGKTVKTVPTAPGTPLSLSTSWGTLSSFLYDGQ